MSPRRRSWTATHAELGPFHVAFPAAPPADTRALYGGVLGRRRVQGVREPETGFLRFDDGPES